MQAPAVPRWRHNERRTSPTARSPIDRSATRATQMQGIGHKQSSFEPCGTAVRELQYIIDVFFDDTGILWAVITGCLPPAPDHVKPVPPRHSASGPVVISRNGRDGAHFGAGVGARR